LHAVIDFGERKRDADFRHNDFLVESAHEGFSPISVVTTHPNNHLGSIRLDDDDAFKGIDELVFFELSYRVEVPRRGRSSWTFLAPAIIRTGAPSTSS
jgi:hypothetical protein